MFGLDVENLCLEVLVSLIFITSKISSNNCCWLVWLKVFLKKGKKNSIFQLYRDRPEMILNEETEGNEW